MNPTFLGNNTYTPAPFFPLLLLSLGDEGTQSFQLPREACCINSKLPSSASQRGTDSLHHRQAGFIGNLKISSHFPSKEWKINFTKSFTSKLASFTSGKPAALLLLLSFSPFLFSFPGSAALPPKQLRPHLSSPAPVSPSSKPRGRKLKQPWLFTPGPALYCSSTNSAQVTERTE